MILSPNLKDVTFYDIKYGKKYILKNRIKKECRSRSLNLAELCQIISSNFHIYKDFINSVLSGSFFSQNSNLKKYEKYLPISINDLSAIFLDKKKKKKIKSRIST